ncbi:MAG: HAD hydrolase-like protein [Bacteroidetes bacterium SB0662_bin_6]|nr:HAD hydrolase-like protein [Bacteroidetes bacterium SB0668_bin_1]MYE05417.1 HAD hydrolase-like protein [Bacteroidetes bacterium SB0662_bin_6]
MPGTTEVKALFFDMDGVLVDVSRSYRRAVEETVEQFTGRQLLPSTIQRYKNLGGFNDDWKLTHAIITDTGMSVPLSRIVDAFQRRYRGEEWNGFIAEEPPLIQTATLNKLHASGRTMGIVTGRPEAEAKWTVNRFDWKKYFPLIVAKEKQEKRFKPDPFPLQHALAMLNAAGRAVHPEMAVYVGDSVDDMTCARKAGVRAIGFIPPYIENKEEMASLLQERGADIVIDDLKELPDLVDQ